MKKIVCLASMVCVSVLMMAGCGSQSEDRFTYRQAGVEQLDAGEYESAVVSFDQALENSKGLVGKFELDVLKYRAEAEYRLEDYAAAAHTYDILIDVDKNRPEYYNLRCMSRAAAGDVTGALDDYTRSVVLDKEAAGRENALLTIGIAMENADRTKEAMTLYQQAQTDGIQNPGLYNRMGLCKLKDQAYDEALELFDLGVQASSDTVMPELIYNQAVTYEFKGDFKKALELMEQYVADYGSDEDAEREIAFLKTR